MTYNESSQELDNGAVCLSFSDARGYGARDYDPDDRSTSVG